MNYGNLFDATGFTPKGRALAYSSGGAEPQYSKRHQPLTEAVRESHVQ